MNLAMNYRRAFLHATTSGEAFLAWHVYFATLATVYARRGDRRMARHYGTRARYWFEAWFKRRQRSGREHAA